MRHLIVRHRRALALATTCVAVGVGIGAITSAGATTTTAPSPAAAGSHASAARHGRMRRRQLLRRAVQGSAVVHTAGGFGTVSFERGTVTSLSGAQLTLTEGTRRASYRSVTVSIPTDARVRDDGSRAALSSLKTGQRVLVIRTPRRTFVVARTPKSR